VYAVKCKSTSFPSYHFDCVCDSFGQECARPVIAMAKSFSNRYVDYLLEKVRACKPAATDYISTIQELWRSTDWNSCERQLPPRYGMVTSNTSECVNTMFGDARDLGWLEAVDRLVDIMSTRIFQCRQKHAKKEGTKVVKKVHEELQLRWDAAAALPICH
jgi:hypothetical protein